MSTEVVSWEDRLKQEAKDVAKTMRPTVTRIGLKSGIMAIGDMAVPGNSLECIVLASMFENVYYDKPYEADVIHPPACYSYSMSGSDMVPHEDIKEPQNPTCHGCWASKFKSARNKKGKACGNRHKLALIPSYKDVADVAKAEIATLSLPVMSVPNWAAYVNLLSSREQRASWGMITRVFVKPDLKTQFKVYFEPVAKLTDEFLHEVDKKIASGVDLLQVPYDLTPNDEQKEQPAADAKKKKF